MGRLNDPQTTTRHAPQRWRRALRRRRLARQLLLGLGVLVVVLVVLIAWVLVASQRSLSHRQGELAELDCGHDNSAGPRLLVTYDSKYASTSDIGVAIAETLCRGGARVDLRLADHVGSVSAYQGVILGSPIYYAAWLPGATGLLERQQEALSQRPVAYFVSSNLIAPDQDTPIEQAKVQEHYIDPVLQQFPKIEPLDPAGMFGGRMRPSVWTLSERLLLKAAGFAARDTRQWPKVERWAAKIGAAMARRTNTRFGSVPLAARGAAAPGAEL